MAWYNFLTPVFQPLLALGPFWAVFIISFALTLLTTLAYKYFTDQAEMKKLKEEQKEFQEKIKSLKDNPQEMMRVQKEAMKKNFEYMKHSFKPMLITMLPIILIFGWMAAFFSYEPIFPGETYSLSAFFEKGVSGQVELLPDQNTELLSPASQDINDEVVWRLKSSIEGSHNLEIKYQNQTYPQKVLISKELVSAEPPFLLSHADIKEIKINYEKLKPFNLLINDPNFSLLGWQPGWLGIYIILSLVFSLGLRKLLKIY